MGTTYHVCGFGHAVGGCVLPGATTARPRSKYARTGDAGVERRIATFRPVRMISAGNWDSVWGLHSDWPLSDRSKLRIEAGGARGASRGRDGVGRSEEYGRNDTGKAARCVPC